MSVTQQQIDSFHGFATEKLDNGGSNLSIDELYELRRLENPTQEEQADVHASIRRGLADVEADRYAPAEEVMSRLREKHGIPCE